MHVSNRTRRATTATVFCLVSSTIHRRKSLWPGKPTKACLLANLTHLEDPLPDNADKAQIVMTKVQHIVFQRE